MRILASNLQFPEGPVALPDGSVLVVEIARETLTRVAPDGRVEVVARVPGGPNGAALGPDGRVYVCNNGGFEWIREAGTLRTHSIAKTYRTGSIDVVDLASGRVDRLYDRCGDHPLRGPNDLVFDRRGGFWFTDLGKWSDRHRDRGFVYWARADGSEIREVAGPLLSPNGIGLSPDGGTLYVADTETARLWAWEVIEPGALRMLPWPAQGGARLVEALGGDGRFDGLAVTRSGTICVAALHACAIVEIPANGGLVRRHPVPDLTVTNLCFGGPDLRSAFVTMSHSGRLAVLDWPEPGLALAH